MRLNRTNILRLLGGLLLGAALHACHGTPSSLVGAHTSAGRLSTLEVEIRIPSLSRRVLALIEDVAQLRVTVIAADGAEYERVLSRSDLDLRQTSLSFEGLVPGGVEVQMAAFDAADRRIGGALSSGVVKPGEVTQLHLTLMLAAESVTSEVPGLTGPLPSLSPTSGPTAFTLPSVAWWVAQAGGGNVWVSVASQGIVKLGPDGSQLQQLDMGSGTGRPVVDGTGHLWFGGPLTRLSPDGTPVSQFPSLTGSLALAPDGHLWLGDGGTLHKLTIDGETVASAFVGAWFHPLLAVVPTTGNVWVALDSALVVRQVSPEGRPLTGTSIPLSKSLGWQPESLTALAADADGHAWVASYLGGKLTKLGPDGAIVGEYPTCVRPRAVAVDASGNIWVGSHAPGLRNLVKHGPDGTALGALTIEGGVRDLAFDATGALWALSERSPRISRLVP